MKHRASDYALDIQHGATHAEFMQARADGVAVWGYALDRHRGLAHDAILAAHRAAAAALKPSASKPASSQTGQTANTNF